MTTTQTPYDLDRAARAGGFDDDMEIGREVARRLHATVKRYFDAPDFAGSPFATKTIIPNIADLWEGDPTANSMWLAMISNALNAMMRDLSAQVREARSAR